MRVCFLGGTQPGGGLMGWDGTWVCWVLGLQSLLTLDIGWSFVWAVRLLTPVPVWISHRPGGTPLVALHLADPEDGHLVCSATWWFRSPPGCGWWFAWHPRDLKGTSDDMTSHAYTPRTHAHLHMHRSSALSLCGGCCCFCLFSDNVKFILFCLLSLSSTLLLPTPVLHCTLFYSFHTLCLPLPSFYGPVTLLNLNSN